MFQFWSRSDRLTAAEKARRVHEAWLDAALRSGRPHPRIPKREVRLGGFESLMRTPGGRVWARAWWDDALTGNDAGGRR